MKLSLGFSPCPNDTFIFYALVNQKIDWLGLHFDFVIEDVEYLNKAALAGELNITKMSYYAYSKLTHQYQMLSSGGALGSNCGPLLIAKNKDIVISSDSKIAIPGLNTTANLLLGLAYPALKDKTEVLFSDIEDAVLDGSFDLGLIIHESRFTYEKKGLHKVIDLGEFWETETHSPIPLGGIAMKRTLSDEVKIKVNKLIHQSTAYAFQHREETMPFVKSYSQQLEDEVINAHIDLYVNDYTLDLGISGKKGVETFFRVLKEHGLVGAYNGDLING